MAYWKLGFCVWVSVRLHASRMISEVKCRSSNQWSIICEYNKKQLQNRRDQEARIALAEKELPELSQINGEIASLSMKCARRLLEGEAASIAAWRKQ